MPKGKGMLKEGNKIGEALRADLDSLNNVGVPEVKVTVREEVEERPQLEIQRINITIDASLLKLVDKHVFELKQQGKKSSRSQMISEGLRNLLDV